MRISDWSSDVCSSDLRGAQRGTGASGFAFGAGQRKNDQQITEPRPLQHLSLGPYDRGIEQGPSLRDVPIEITGIGARGREEVARAWGRAGVCRDVSNWGGVVAQKKTTRK